MDDFVLKLSKEDIRTLLLGSEVYVSDGLTDVTVKLNNYSSNSELEVGEND